MEAGGVGKGDERGRAEGDGDELDGVVVVVGDELDGFRARGEGGQGGRRCPGGVRPRPRPSDTRLDWFLELRFVTIY